MGAGKNSKAVVVALAGVAAGVVSTFAQLLLWLVSGTDPLALLLRDSRLTAALVMGESVLPPPAAFDPMVMLVATVIHFLLSVVYAAMLLPLRRSNLELSQLIGAGFGAALYAVNLHGFTLLFPWFAAARGGITLTAHLVFGMTVMLVYWYCASRDRSGVPTA
jgi:hypothetical protein